MAESPGGGQEMTGHDVWFCDSLYKVELDGLGGLFQIAIIL